MKKIALWMLTAMLLTACGSKKNQMPEANNDFAVITVQTTEADLNTSYPASIKGMQDIEIRPKVSGYLTRLLVDEGATVRKGQPLFLIDSEQYRASVKASAEANLQSAKDNLKWCTVTSPSDGVVGMIPYRVGSLVSASSAQPLTTVSNINEMYVYFSMTEKQLLALTREQGGVNAAISKMPAVNLILADGTEFPQSGVVSTVSGVIDQSTGSVQMRATFKNDGHILRSGGTGSILVPTHAKDAIKVPQKSTFDIQNKKFIYVVDKNNTVTSREITVLPQHDGTDYVVTSGVKAGERIVVDGVNQLKNGMKIKPITPAQAAAAEQKAKQALKDGKMPGEN